MLDAMLGPWDWSAVIVQAALASFGLSAMWLSTGNSERGRRWGPVVGLLGQPFWFWHAVSSNAGGIFVLSIAFSVVYFRAAALRWPARTVGTAVSVVFVLVVVVLSWWLDRVRFNW